MPNTPPTALVILGGDPIEIDEAGALPGHPALVVAADSGIDQAHRLGIRVDLAVGDFDSVTDGGLARASAAGTEIERHPSEKDTTDFELALEAVARRGLARVVVAGGEGGRLDHIVGNALVMSSERFAALEITAVGRRGARAHLVRSSRELVGEPGEYVTLLALHGPADGVRTHGLRYPLHGERLEAGSGRGVSNEMARPVARVELTSGALLAVLPGPSYRRDAHGPVPRPDPRS